MSNGELNQGHLYYLQDSRDFVGNNVLWWTKDGIGYTTDLSQAEVFSKVDAFKQHASRVSDFPWPKAYIDSKARAAVDFQDISQEGASNFDAAHQPEQEQIILNQDEDFMSRIRLIMNKYGFQNREMADDIVALVQANQKSVVKVEDLGDLDRLINHAAIMGHALVEDDRNRATESWRSLPQHLQDAIDKAEAIIGQDEVQS
ncbi:hypothetical protein LG200_05220 [Methylobacillus caricis]|uniref:hypothetical protein n=1 Tax=Methylobacillus caricis TaxID=1971611 RepID=UPI001CFFC194|nr:hypothetical protein [Methylobacillus caricis]MCB5187405.1 hypothetical protein [Methylobacillus caricis]